MSVMPMRFTEWPCASARVSYSPLLFRGRFRSAASVTGGSEYGVRIVLLAGFFSDVLLDHDPHTSGEAHELHPELMLVFQFFKFSSDLQFDRFFRDQGFFDVLNIDTQSFQRSFTLRQEGSHQGKLVEQARWRQMSEH